LTAYIFIEGAWIMNNLPLSRDITRITLGVLFIGVLVAASFWIMRPFLLALIWAWKSRERQASGTLILQEGTRDYATGVLALVTFVTICIGVAEPARGKAESARSFVQRAEWLRSGKALAIYAKDIKESERKGEVPKQGYVWHD
jgi:hypothetical protein